MQPEDNLKDLGRLVCERLGIAPTFRIDGEGYPPPVLCGPYRREYPPVAEDDGVAVTVLLQATTAIGMVMLEQQWGMLDDEPHLLWFVNIRKRLDLPVLWPDFRASGATLAEALCRAILAATEPKSAEYMPLMETNLEFPFSALSEDQAQLNHHQTLARLRERGGLAPAEAVALARRERFRGIHQDEAIAILKQLDHGLRVRR